ncbi:HAD-IA family hydrolase [candidate division KSB1 bacterium]|nr:HAD-IA family hydrolase [candidate division KSB1 bacterium]
MALKSLTVKVVFFDIGGVLVHVDKMRMRQNLMSLTALDEIEFAQVLEKSNSFHKGFDKGMIQPPELYERFSDLVEKEFTYADFVKAYTDLFELNEPVMELAKSLKKNAFISIISNTDPLHYKRIDDDYGLSNWFENPILSYEHRVVKPSKEIYSAAIDAFGIDASDALFVDDLAENVQAAQEFGMEGIVYDHCKQLEKELLKYIRLE